MSQISSESINKNNGIKNEKGNNHFSKSQAYKNLDSPIRALNLGPSLAQNGGMATVQQLILKHVVGQTIQPQHICTHDEGTIFYRFRVFLFAFFRYLQKLLRRDVDLVHIHISERGSVIRKVILILLSLAFNKPVLVHTHGAEFQVFFLELPFFFQKTLSYIFRQCNGFIVLSKSWQDFYTSQLGLDPRKVFLLSNSVELPSDLPNRSSREKISFLFCGRVGERKGAFDLIQALALLSPTLRSQMKLIIAGDGDIEQAKTLATQLSVMDQTTFLGWVKPKQRDQLLQQADVFILPSYNEGLPLSILEAMAWQLPIITTPVGGIPEVIVSQDNGLLINPGDVQALSHAMQSLVENEEFRLALGKCSRETAKSFDIATYGERLACIYGAVLQDHR